MRTLRQASRRVLSVLAWAAIAACAAAPDGAGENAAHDARRADVRFPHGRAFVAEIADTPELWQRGYMFRKEVRDDEAMIFVFPEAGFHPFWMKNTLVPLDMIWMDDAFTVIHLQIAAPPCAADPCPSYGPLRKARYVLEVRGGAAAHEGLKVGDRMQISFPQPAG